MLLCHMFQQRRDLLITACSATVDQQVEIQISL